MFALASLAGCGIGNSSDLPVTKLVANLPAGDVVPAVAIADDIQVTFVVPAGVEVGAVLYIELLHIPPT